MGKQRGTRNWSTEEVTALISKYKRLGRLFTLPGRSRNAIVKAAQKYKQKTKRHDGWTAKEIRYLRYHWPTKSSTWLSAQLGRSVNAICNKALRLKLQKVRRTRAKKC